MATLRDGYFGGLVAYLLNLAYLLLIVAMLRWLEKRAVSSYNSGSSDDAADAKVEIDAKALARLS